MIRMESNGCNCVSRDYIAIDELKWTSHIPLDVSKVMLYCLLRCGIIGLQVLNPKEVLQEWGALTNILLCLMSELCEWITKHFQWIISFNYVVLKIIIYNLVSYWNILLVITIYIDSHMNYISGTNASSHTTLLWNNHD